jgi:hypothetical protein
MALYNAQRHVMMVVQRTEMAVTLLVRLKQTGSALDPQVCAAELRDGHVLHILDVFLLAVIQNWSEVNPAMMEILQPVTVAISIGFMAVKKRLAGLVPGQDQDLVLQFAVTD